MTDITGSATDIRIEPKYHLLDFEISGVDDDEILEQLEKSNIVNYVVSNVEIDEVIKNYSWDDIKDYFKPDVISEAITFDRSELIDEIGWDYIKTYFDDYIDEEVSNRVKDIIARETA